MNQHRRRIVVMVGVMAGLCVSAYADFIEVTVPNLNLDIRTLTDGSRYDPLIPSTQTFNGVPFAITENAAGNNAWFTDNPGSLDIPVNVAGTTRVFTIINSSFGSFGATRGSVEFFGSNGDVFSVPLVEGDNLRDHFDGEFNNVIDGVNALPAFTGGPEQARLDMQVFVLPDAFANETLTSMRFNSAGASLDGNPFIVAVTAETPGGGAAVIPVPGAALLAAIGAAVVGSLRRRHML